MCDELCDMNPWHVTYHFHTTHIPLCGIASFLGDQSSNILVLYWFLYKGCYIISFQSLQIFCMVFRPQPSTLMFFISQLLDVLHGSPQEKLTIDLPPGLPKMTKAPDALPDFLNERWMAFLFKPWEPKGTPQCHPPPKK